VKTIVCAVDSSSAAAEAVRVAVGLRDELGLRLVLAHVAEGPRVADRTVHAEARRTGEQLLEELASVHGLNGDVELRAEAGDRASELARIAGEEAATLVVVGTPRRGRLRRRLTGLVAELNGIAHCPVLVVPPRGPG
jgi:nucleotide-binding universal stress UspA family protein